MGTLKGSELVGLSYAPLFPFFAEQPGAFRVLAADFVSTEDGTGVVHLSPGHGEADQTVCNANGIDTVVPMDAQGHYTAEVETWAGLHVFDANPLVVRALKDAGHVVRHDTYQHSYPHCWRCAKPLVYRAMSSWFVEVTAFRDRMVELNQEITWVPDHIRDGSFGKWLANARDWSISRNRFWGSPIPVWKSDDPRYPRVDVYGSLDEIERDFGVRPTDLHRPMVDALVRPNPDDPTGASMMRRVPEVLDCWFESGSMPYAQVHYPFENQQWFEHHYPGDFIVEYIGQTRGWFYTLHVLATALFDRPSFATCVSHGILLGDDSQKMSKSLRNYPDPFAVFDTYGADAMRWYLLSSPVVRGGDLVVGESGIRDAVRQVLLPLWNAWSFLALYANAAGVEGRTRMDSTDVLDRYVLAKTHELVTAATSCMDAYDLSGASAALLAHLDTLTNWYIRRSRNRFWLGEQAAIDTLHTVLAVTCRVGAPLLPLLTEHIYRAITAERSVHLTDWPDTAELPADAALVAAMDRAREVCSAALERAQGQRAAGAPAVGFADRGLPRCGCARALRRPHRRRGQRQGGASHRGRGLRRPPGPAGRARRRRPAARTGRPAVIRAVRGGDWVREGDTVVAGGIALQEGEYALRLVLRRTRRPARRCPGVPASSCSTLPSRPSWSPRGWLVISSGSSSRPAGMPASTCPTASPSRSGSPHNCRRAWLLTRASWPPRPCRRSSPGPTRSPPAPSRSVTTQSRSP